MTWRTTACQLGYRSFVQSLALTQASCFGNFNMPFISAYSKHTDFLYHMSIGSTYEEASTSYSNSAEAISIGEGRFSCSNMNIQSPYFVGYRDNSSRRRQLINYMGRGFFSSPHYSTVVMCKPTLSPPAAN